MIVSKGLRLNASRLTPYRFKAYALSLQGLRLNASRLTPCLKDMKTVRLTLSPLKTLV